MIVLVTFVWLGRIPGWTIHGRMNKAQDFSPAWRRRHGRVAQWTSPGEQSSGLFTRLVNGSKKNSRQELGLGLIFKTHLSLQPRLPERLSFVMVLPASTQGHKLGTEFSAGSSGEHSIFKSQQWLHYSSKISSSKTREMAQWARGMAHRLRAFASFAEHVDSVPSTHVRQFTTTCNYSSQVQWPLLVSVGNCTHGRHRWVGTHTQIKHKM